MVSDFVECATLKKDHWQEACAWAIGSIVAPELVAVAARSVLAVRISLRTGVGLEEAYAALRATQLDAAAAAQMEQTVARAVAKDCVTPVPHSFSADTKVVLADGRAKAISQVRLGDAVRSTDPTTGRTTAHRVTHLFRHDDTDLADVTVLDDHGHREVVRMTAHHPFWVSGENRWLMPKTWPSATACIARQATRRR